VTRSEVRGQIAEVKHQTPLRATSFEPRPRIVIAKNSEGKRAVATETDLALAGGGEDAPTTAAEPARRPWPKGRRYSIIVDAKIFTRSECTTAFQSMRVRNIDSASIIRKIVSKPREAVAIPTDRFGSSEKRP